MQREYLIRSIGDKKLYRKHGADTKLRYFSNTECAKQERAEVLGYTNLKQKQKKKTKPIGVLKYGRQEISYVYSEKTAYKSIKGYFQTDNNTFVAIEKTNPFFWLLPLLIALFLILTLAFCGKDTMLPGASTFFPNIDQSIYDESTTSAATVVPQIKVAGFSAWHIPAGQTDNLPIPLKNPKGNPCYFSFSIVLNNGETIYQSDMVPPGESIRQIDIAKPLVAGEYEAVIHIATTELNTGKALNSADLNITITVQ